MNDGKFRRNVVFWSQIGIVLCCGLGVVFTAAVTLWAVLSRWR